MKSLVSAIAASIFIFGSLPATSNYQLNSYGFGSGGGVQSTSNYSTEGISGELSGQDALTGTYNAKPGFIETQQANVPKVTLSNPSNFYDRLKFVIDPQYNPGDALYALQISTTSDFSSGVSYVHSDLTIGPTLGLGDYQTFSAWGGSSGANTIGLAPSTTYYIRAKATQGKYTESAYGPSSSAATSGQQISFCLYSNANCAAGGAAEAFGGLTPTAISNSPTNIGIDFATNANAGGSIYAYSANGGLRSASASYTIGSATADLNFATEGYGAQIASASQSAGGPLGAVAPYNGTANSVGALGTVANAILSSSGPLSGGTAALQLKAKPSNLTPSAGDYSDTVTIIAAAEF